MGKLIENLILKYEKHLKAGGRNLKEMKLFGQEATKKYHAQACLVSIWKIILKDLQSIADKEDHEDDS